MSAGRRAVLNLIRFNKPSSGIAYFCSSSKNKHHQFEGVPSPAAAARKPNEGGTGRRSAADDVAEMAKAGVVGAVETGLKLGEIAKQAVDGTWDATKTTAERVIDSVADTSSSDEDSGDGGLNHRGENRGLNGSDKHVEDLRRLARGCDLKNK